MLRSLAEIIEHKQQLVLHLAGVTMLSRHGILDGVALHGQQKPASGNGGLAVKGIFEAADRLACFIQEGQNGFQSRPQLSVQLGLEGQRIRPSTCYRNGLCAGPCSFILNGGIANI
ncbi:hypothetical protein D3C75_926670 [compost metagenome]